eukprot:13935-Heterococcus_DN1.PRE.1
MARSLARRSAENVFSSAVFTAEVLSCFVGGGLMTGWTCDTNDDRVFVSAYKRCLIQTSNVTNHYTHPLVSIKPQLHMLDPVTISKVLTHTVSAKLLHHLSGDRFHLESTCFFLTLSVRLASEIKNMDLIASRNESAKLAL